MSRTLLFSLLLALTQAACAATPSEDIIRTCAAGYLPSAIKGIAFTDISPHKVSSEDDYADGYNATFFFKYKNKDIGYAERGENPDANNTSIIGLGKLHPLTTATPIKDGDKPSTFTPDDAIWSIVRGNSESYLCVSFNFDGLGKSGSFQRVRGGYLLEMEKTNKPGFYYFVYYLKK